MKKILLSITLSIAFALHNNSAQAQYKNFAPQQWLMDTLFSGVVTGAPPAYNLLYDKAIHPGYFAYTDGDLFTDTLDIADLYQYYTELIDMSTNGYTQFTALGDLDSVNTAISYIKKRNSINFVNYKYAILNNDSVYSKNVVDTTGGFYNLGTGYYAGAYPLYSQSRLMASSPSYNEFDDLASNVLWFNPATYYGNDPYTNYSPIINFGTGFMRYKWNDTLVIPSFIDTAEIVIQIGLVRNQDPDTLYANTYLRKRPYTTYYHTSGGIGGTNVPLATLILKELNSYNTNGKYCGIPHEQPVHFMGQYAGGDRINDGYFTISYGKVNGVRRAELERPVILVDGVDFGSKDNPEGWNYYLNECGSTGYYSFKNGLEMTSNPLTGHKEHYEIGTEAHSKKYNFAFENLPSFIDSINEQGYDFIFLDFPKGADDMRNNAGVLTALIDIVVKFHNVVDLKSTICYFKFRILFLNCVGFILNISGFNSNHFCTASNGVFTFSSFLKEPCLRRRL